MVPFLFLQFLCRKKSKGFKEQFVVQFFGYSNAIQESNKILKKSSMGSCCVFRRGSRSYSVIRKLHEIDPDRMIFLTVTTKTAWDYMQQYVKTVILLDAQKI